MHERIYNFIKAQVKEGGQAYVVCPMVEENDTDLLKSAKEYSSFLSEKLFPLKVGMLHGKMKDAEKNEVMDKFKEGEFHVLVSTTVIEVGVDVPNANLMIVENAERFGLSQLHQLRGRVGRGERESYCVLFASTKNQEAISKLRVIESSNDGFYISEQDLLMRGPGDYFGTRQSGFPALKNSNPVSEVELLYKSKESVELIVSGELSVTTEEEKLVNLGIKKMYDIGNDFGVIN
jgi:ATP-dependent DNA helicase RecG